MSGVINTLLRFAPEWLLTLVDAMVQRDSFLLRWVKRHAAAGLAVPVPGRPDKDAQVRVFFGPFNYAGQAWRWSRSLEHANAGINARNLTVTFPNDLGFESSDRVLAPVFVGSREWRRLQRDAFDAYTHVVIESFTSTLGMGRGRGLEAEIEWHQSQGRRVALLCHGTDIRSPRAHSARSVHSPFLQMDRADERLEKRARQNQGVLDRFDGPVFFSTPDLVHDVPNGQWLPLVVDAEKWSRAGSAGGVAAGERRIPAVLHAPTAPRIKGTAAVERAVHRLSDAIEYRALAGVPASQMPKHVAEADIVIDQLLLGSYGAAACEAMAAGRAVVGNIDPEVRETVERACGLALPIIQADPDTIEEVLRRLAANREEIRESAALGPAFVKAIHSGRRTLPVMNDFLGFERVR
ncbi:hypothetical protein GCM10009786_18020 [Leucobacter alluvii]|uniref:Glycosyltransferase involved in cell wall biosynthesis n=1 Tax=Leucobacter alluvii TaxID=340321 RepID=A0ABN3B884_9MICO